MLYTPSDPCATGSSLPVTSASSRAAPPASDVRLAPPSPADQLDPELAELRAITLAGLKAILSNPDTPPREFRLTAAVALRFITAAEREIRRAAAPPSSPRAERAACASPPQPPAITSSDPLPRPRAIAPTTPIPQSADPAPSPSPSPSLGEIVHSPPILSAIGAPRPTPAAALACAAGSARSLSTVMALLSGSSPEQHTTAPLRCNMTEVVHAPTSRSTSCRAPSTLSSFSRSP